jgi:hypothetical protein
MIRIFAVVLLVLSSFGTITPCALSKRTAANSVATNNELAGRIIRQQPASPNTTYA